MIYTVTFNPALDYVVRMEQFQLGQVNRTTSEEIQFGGKGINVSVLLKNIGVQNCALGFVAGFTGKALENQLQTMGVDTDFIHLPEGMTRINVKMKADCETEINAQGPKIGREQLEQLFERLDRLEKEDVLVLAGSIPSSLPSDIYENILERMEGKQILAAVDATKELLCNVLKYHPFLIKPNHIELGEIFGVQLHTEEQIREYAGRLQQMGARNVLISMAGDGALLLDETGGFHRINAPKGTVKNSVGAGDSMVAGFLAGYLQSKDYRTALKMGTAAGSATAFSDQLATGEEVLALYQTLK